MKRLHINYNETSNHFEKIKNVRTDLIYGDPKYIKTPWFSYIIPVFKRPDLLRQTLDSVLDQEETIIAVLRRQEANGWLCCMEMTS